MLNHLSARDKQLLQAEVFSDNRIMEYQFDIMLDQEMKIPELGGSVASFRTIQ